MRTQYRTTLALAAIAITLGGATACGEPPVVEAETIGATETIDDAVPVLAESTSVPAPIESLVTETAPAADLATSETATTEGAESHAHDEAAEAVEEAAPAEVPNEL